MLPTAFVPIPAETSTSTAPVQGKARFTPEALKYLRKCFKNGAYPTRAQKAEMTEYIRQIPGNENTNIDRVGRYFAGKRQSESASRKNSGQESDLYDMEATLFPRLIPDKRVKLDQLHRAHPEPKDEMMVFWAERLGIEIEDVLGWVKYKRLRQRDTPSVHLPTPATSISPPARYASLPSTQVKQETSVEIPYLLSPAHTPIVAKPEPCQTVPTMQISNNVEKLNSVQSMSRKAPQLPLKIEPPVATVPVPPRVHVPRMTNVPFPQNVESRTPKTVEEFNSMSEGIVESLKRFIESHHRRAMLSQD